MENLNRRECLGLMAFAFRFQSPDWTCPMDADVHLDHAGQCPRCGMTLVLKVPDAAEYRLNLSVEPRRLVAGDEATLVMRVVDPGGKAVHAFDVVHEKLIHLFIVSEDLQFFAHEHPAAREDDSFSLRIRLPKAGMYRMLADYFPAGATPQLTVQTVYVSGRSVKARLETSEDSLAGENVSALIRLEPAEPVAGLQSRLFYDLHPGDGLEKYLGAWGHLLMVSEDLVDLMHLHPVGAQSATVQYDVIFPRPGRYKVWSQFQRRGVVNTIVCTVAVTSI